MKILVVGAGAVGGYFGGRLMQAGRDVTFLVRQRRKAELAEYGLTIRSRFGDFHTMTPQLASAERLAEPFDLIFLSCKAYDLDGAMTSFAKAVGSKTVILPLLNGLRHFDLLASRFGGKRVLGGLCAISATLGANGEIVHLNEMQSLTFGELDGSRSPRIEAIAAVLLGAGFEARLSEAIRQDIWEKWIFIATGAGINCLMRAAVGDIVAAGAADLVTKLLAECAAIAAAHGFPPRARFLEEAEAIFTARGSPLMASMLRDLERGKPVEADQILGDLLRRAPKPDDRSILRIAFANVKSYEARRKREETSAKSAEA